MVLKWSACSLSTQTILVQISLKFAIFRFLVIKRPILAMRGLFVVIGGPTVEKSVNLGRTKMSNTGLVVLLS